MRYYKEKQICFVKKEVKKNEIPICKLLLNRGFLTKKKKSQNHNWVSHAPTIFCPVPSVIVHLVLQIRIQ